MEYNQEKYKEILKQTFRAFAQFCKSHDIQYVAAYGTMLGAVRHHGCIPWDDDVDVYMKREAYEKFLSLRKDASLGGYEIIDRHDAGYYLPFAKFCHRDSSLWEERLYPYMMGVFIDIFPLDEASDNEQCRKLKKKYSKAFDHYKYACQDYRWSDIHSFHDFKRWRRNKYWQLMRKRAIRKMDELEARLKKVEGASLLYYRSLLPFERSLFPKEWFDHIVEQPFEDGNISILASYDAYLTMCYGDYMQLPPVEQRVSVHDHYYVDLEQRKSIEEARKELNG